MAEKNISINNYKDSLNKEELDKFNDNVNHLVFLDAAYHLYSQRQLPVRGIIVMHKLQEKSEDENDKIND